VLLTNLDSIRGVIATRRKQLGLRQSDLARMAQISLPTLKVFEQGKRHELGFAKVVRILTALGLELRLQEANRGRPTLDQLREEVDDD
jgi:transcriptional regulator with XRE-family HTH domain